MSELLRGTLRQVARRPEWLAFAGLAGTALILGYIGFEKQPGVGRTALDNLYRSLQLWWLEYGSDSEPASWELDAARLLAVPILPFLAGIAVVAIFRERISIAVGKPWRARVLVCGLGRKGLRLARDFRARGYHVVAIEQDKDNHRIARCRDEGIPVLVGDVTDAAVLRKARVGKARYVISVCGSDGTNADVAAHAEELATAAREVTAFAHITDLELCQLLRNIDRDERPDSFRLEVFNVFESGARAWLGQYPPLQDGDRPFHLVVVGVGQMGMSLVIGAARKWLTLRGGTESRPRITIVDREAGRRRESLRLKHPQLEAMFEVVAVETDVTWPKFQEAGFLFDAPGRCSATAIYVCLDDDASGVAAALTLLERVKGHDVTIVVRTAEEGGLASTLERAGAREDSFRLLRAFPLIDRTSTAEMLLGETFDETLARTIHETYVRHERQAGKTDADNPALVDWADLPEALKESNRRQADHIAVKLKEVQCGYAPLTEADVDRFAFSSEEIEQLARMEHERWVGERLFEGWTYAPEPKDLRRKTSPALVPWDQLTEEEKEKDRAAARELPAHLAAAGYRAYRRQSSR